MKKAVWIAVLLAVAMCVVPVWSQGRGGGQGGPGGPGRPGGPGPGAGIAVPPPPPAMAIDVLTEALALTTEQASALKDVLTKNEATLQPLMKAAGDAGKALHEAVFAAEYDAAQVETLAAAALAAQAKVLEANIDAWAQVRGVLSAEQFAAMQQMRGPGGPGGPGGPPPGGGGREGARAGRR